MSPYFLMLRPKQWIKNSFVMAGVLFGGHAGNFQLYPTVMLVLVYACAASSSVYIFNDILDRNWDLQHPRKRLRPIASGQVPVRQAASISIILAALALFGTALVNQITSLCIFLYLLNSVIYSLWFKNHALLDVLSIAIGFVLRLLAGVYLLGDLPTTWILLCTFFLALFLGIAKRRAELISLDGERSRQRSVLNSYSIPFLDVLLGATGVMTMVCYALFTVMGGKSPSQLLTLPLVFYAVFHYLQMVMSNKVGEDPADILFDDFKLIVIIMTWLSAYLAIEHWHPSLFR